jgi:hypothetical protein
MLRSDRGCGEFATCRVREGGESVADHEQRGGVVRQRALN